MFDAAIGTAPCGSVGGRYLAEEELEAGVPQSHLVLVVGKPLELEDPGVGEEAYVQPDRVLRLAVRLTHEHQRRDDLLHGVTIPELPRNRSLSDRSRRTSAG